MHVSILITSFNTRELTLGCLLSILDQTQKLQSEIILVDNCSTDGSAAAIAKMFPIVRLIEPGKNLGFAAGNNLAARHASGEFLLLLNPDTVVLDQAIERAVQFAREHPEAGIIGGRTLFGDRSLNRESCHGAPTLWSLLCIGLGLSSLFRKSAIFNPEGLGSWRRNSVRTVDCVTGCFLLIRRQLWDRLGGFDESFFMYGEDTDLCIRAAAAGATSIICPEAELIHYGGKSEPVRAEKMVRLFRAKAQLFAKHWSPGSVWFGIWMLQLWALTRTIGTWIAIRLGRDRLSAYQAWREVFRRRSEYSRSHLSNLPQPPVSDQPATGSAALTTRG